MLGRGRQATALFGLLLLALLPFWKAVFGGEALYERDTAFWYYPQADDIVRVVTSGSSPFWDPYRAFGQPLLANPSNQILYPPTWLNLLLEPWTFYTCYVVGHLLFSGAGLYLIARGLGVSGLGSFLSAGAWMASGPLLSMANIWNHYAGAAWIPWVFLAARRASETQKARDALLWGAVISGQALAGSADMCAIAALLSVLGTFQPSRRWLLSLATAWGFAAASTAVQWLPALELLRGSARWGLPEAARTLWSVHPLAMIQAAVPLALKGLSLETADQTLALEIRAPLLASLYLGVPVLGLAAAACLGPRRPLRRFLLCVFAAGLLVALGRHSFFYGALVALVPPLGIIRHPVKAMILAPFACALLAGMGLDALRPLEPRRSRKALLLGCGVLVLGCALVGALALAALEGRVNLPFRPGTTLDTNLAMTARQALLASLAGLGVTGIALRRPSLSPGLLAAIALGELLSVTARLNPTAPSRLFAEPPATVAAIAADGAPAGTRVHSWDYLQRVVGKRHPGPEVVQALESLEPHGLPRTLGLRLLSPACGRFGLSGSFDADPLGLSAPYARAMVLASLAAQETPHFVRLLQMGGVRYVLALHREGLEDLLPLAAASSPLGLPVQVFRVPDPMPLVYAVGVGRAVAEDAGYLALTAADFDFRRHVLLAGGPMLASREFAGSVRVLENKPDRLRVQADLAAPGYVVVTGAYDPGWRASVDGRPAVVQRANVAFRAVQVPAGSHVVEQVYRPKAVAAGFLVSALGLALGVGAGVLLGRPPRNPE